MATERLDLSAFDKHNLSGNADESMMSADDSTYANTTMTTAASSLAGDLDSEESEFGKTASSTSSANVHVAFAASKSSL